jgi:hypothetical protein
MVTVRNSRGQAMLDEAVRRGRVEVLSHGGHGGAALPSGGKRQALTMKTVAADSMVRSALALSIPPPTSSPPRPILSLRMPRAVSARPILQATNICSYHHLTGEIAPRLGVCACRQGRAAAGGLPAFAWTAPPSPDHHTQPNPNHTIPYTVPSHPTPSHPTSHILVPSHRTGRQLARLPHPACLAHWPRVWPFLHRLPLPTQRPLLRADHGADARGAARAAIRARAHGAVRRRDGRAARRGGSGRAPR